MILFYKSIFERSSSALQNKPFNRGQWPEKPRAGLVRGFSFAPKKDDKYLHLQQG
jgi:hypothetical protein